MRLLLTFLLHAFVCTNLAAQSLDLSLPANINHLGVERNTSPSRKWIAAGSSGVSMAGSLVLEFKGDDPPLRARFQVDRKKNAWMHIDKLMHGYVAYSAARSVDALLRWAGVPDKKAAWWGAGSGLLFTVTKELFDGFQVNDGWNWGDVGADFTGSTLFLVQQLTWGEQRIQLKFSALPKRYSDAMQEAQARKYFGNHLSKRLIRDYNQQTFWLSANAKSLTNLEWLPAWLNVSVGFGAENLLSGKNNIPNRPDEIALATPPNLQRYRQWYLAPDIDFTRIPTKSKFLKTTFFVLNAFKFPAPALELSKGKLRVNALVW